MLSKPNFSY